MVQFNLDRISYGRRGSFLYVGAWTLGGKERLYLASLHSGLDNPHSGSEEVRAGGRLTAITLRRDGQELDYTAAATPTGVTLSYEGGSARICLQKGDIFRMEATGAQIVIAPPLKSHEIAKNRGDGSWEVCMHPIPKLLLYPVRGSMSATASFDVISSMPGPTEFVFSPDETGTADAAIHMYLSNSKRLERYPDFDALTAEIEAEFEAYLDTAPILPKEYEESRRLAAYLVWSHIMPLDGREAVYMNKGIHRSAFSWQQSYQAMGQYRNPQLAWDFLSSMFHYQDDYGMLPDSVNDVTLTYIATKPPLQGLAFLFLSKYTDFSFVPRKDYLFLYEGLARSVYWWLSFRDTDNDGIAQFDSADESGWDDSSMFRKGIPLETADLAAYIIMAMDSLSIMADHLGKSYEARDWKEKADKMTAAMVENFWNGEEFVALINSTHETVTYQSSTKFIPLLLGERLPRDIREKLVSELMTEGRWLTEYGFAGESTDSAQYVPVGWLAGPLLAPIHLLTCLGLSNSGYSDEAAEISRRYCRTLINANFAMIIDAQTGLDCSEGRWSNRYPNRMSWTAMVFLVLGSLFL